MIFVIIVTFVYYIIHLLTMTFFSNYDRLEFFSRKSRSCRGQSHISPLLPEQRELATNAWEEARSVDINRGWGPVADARHRAYSRGYKNIAFISHRGVSSSRRDFLFLLLLLLLLSFAIVRRTHDSIFRKVSALSSLRAYHSNTVCHESCKRY